MSPETLKSFFSMSHGLILSHRLKLKGLGNFEAF